MPNNIPKIKINGIEITQKTLTKFIEVIINHNLDWKEYTEHIAHQVAKHLNIIRCIMKFIYKKASLNLYFT